MKHFLTLSLISLIVPPSPNGCRKKTAETVDKNKIERPIYLSSGTTPLKGRHTGTSRKIQIAAS